MISFAFVLGGTGLVFGSAPGNREFRPAGLTIFDEEPDTALPSSLDGTEFRGDTLYLLSGASADPSVYAFANSTDQPCLLTVYLAGERFSTCTSPAAFALNGMQLRTVTSRVLQPNGPYPQRTDVRDTIRWAPDGTFTVTSSLVA